jgi:uncharacterized protein (DUF849 family)
MGANLIINACINGMVPTRAKNPHTPITPEEVVREAVNAAGSGAAIVHLHARGADETFTWDPGVYREIIQGIRSETPEIIICATTSGRLWSEREKRAAVLLLEDRCRPDMASLTLGSMNFPKQASMNPPETIQYLLDTMKAQGIRPECEVFDPGMIDYLGRLSDTGFLQTPYFVNLILGNRGTSDATPLNLAWMVDRLPPGGVWAAGGIGVTQFAMNNMAIAMGGHVRVGIEDNLYLANKTPATNTALINRVVEVARAMDRQPMSPAEARTLLGLPSPSSA